MVLLKVNNFFKKIYLKKFNMMSIKNLYIIIYVVMKKIDVVN